jgi:predicted  nucleic acid-binding Zn-ribbon protein
MPDAESRRKQTSTLRRAMSPENERLPTASTEIERLVSELEQAEAYEQKLRQLIVEARDALAGGQVEQALSMLNTALNDIDSATDVVVPSHRMK